MKYEPESEWLLKNGGFPFNTCFAEDRAKGRKVPIYVDLGCSHPVNLSQTAFLRELGWAGLGIDGNPDYAKDWADARYGDHFCCEVLSNKPVARFCIHDNSQTSRISDGPETDYPERWGIKSIAHRPTVSLNYILEARGIGLIDLLAVDLEGAEFDVLQTLDFEKHSPAFIISEYVTHGEGIDPRVCRMLLDRGYEVIHMTESNLIYRRK